MKREVDIDNYYDGYKSSELNCIDLPIAAASGAFNRKNYFYYCFMYCLYMNFKLNYREEWIRNHEIILESLGLKLVVLEVEENNVIRKIQECLDKQMPVIMIVKYGKLFYSRYYGWGTYNHGIIVSDYDDEIEIVGIRDREAIREHIDYGIFNSDVIHRIPLKYSYLLEIWSGSNDEFKKENLPYMDKIFAIRKKTNCEININRCLKSMIYEQNMLEVYIKNLKPPYIFNDSEFEAIRRIYYRSFIPFFDIIEKIIQDIENRRRLKEIKEKFMQQRMLVLNYIQRCILKNEIIDYGKIQNDTTELFELLTSLIEIIPEYEGENRDGRM